MDMDCASPGYKWKEDWGESYLLVLWTFTRRNNGKDESKTLFKEFPLEKSANENYLKLEASVYR